MNEIERVLPPPSSMSTQADRSALYGCTVAACVAMVPGLYIGSYLLLVMHDVLGLRLLSAPDPRTEQILRIVYGPIVWIARTAMAMAG